MAIKDKIVRISPGDVYCFKEKVNPSSLRQTAYFCNKVSGKHEFSVFNFGNKEKPEFCVYRRKDGEKFASKQVIEEIFNQLDKGDAVVFLGSSESSYYSLRAFLRRIEGDSGEISSSRVGNSLVCFRKGNEQQRDSMVYVYEVLHPYPRLNIIRNTGIVSPNTPFISNNDVKEWFMKTAIECKIFKEN